MHFLAGLRTNPGLSNRLEITSRFEFPFRSLSSLGAEGIEGTKGTTSWTIT